jgi:hypothetical protein
LTYDPPLSDTDKGLDYILGPSAGGVQQSEPPRKLVNLHDVPVVVMTAEASYHVNFDHHTVDFLRRAGVPAEHLHLAEHGLSGNGHLMAIEQNNADLAALIESWLAPHDKRWSVPLGGESGRDVSGEHAGILEAAVARDTPRAVDLLTAHIRRTTDILLTSEDATGAAATDQTAAMTPE